jgi:hypothetical protein
MPSYVPVSVRLERSVIKDPNSGCWLWTKGMCWRGYGRIGINQKTYLAHRVSYELHIGGSVGDLCVLHKCDTPSCINPDHLYAGTRQDNSNDQVSRGRQTSGVRNYHAKLTDEIVLKIRAATGTHRAIAAEFSVSHPTVTYIKTRKTWRHLK